MNMADESKEHFNRVGNWADAWRAWGDMSLVAHRVLMKELRGFVGVSLKKDHNLIRIAAAVSLKLNSDETLILENLSYFVKATGRYPIPTQHHDLSPNRNAESVSGIRATSTTCKDSFKKSQLFWAKARKCRGWIELVEAIRRGELTDVGGGVPGPDED
jgi:hypothetical protein